MDKFTKLVKIFKREFPNFKVSVRRVSIKDFGTWTLLDKKKQSFLIKIDKKSTESEQIDTLIHEWAHVLVADKTYENESEHHTAWGKSYAKLYRIYEENFLNE